MDIPNSKQTNKQPSNGRLKTDVCFWWIGSGGLGEFHTPAVALSSSSVKVKVHFVSCGDPKEKTKHEEN